MFVIRNLVKYHSTVTKLIAYAPVEVLTSQNVIIHLKIPPNSYRFFTQKSTTNNQINETKSTETKTANTNPTSNIGEYDTLTEYQAYDMIHKLSDNDRLSLSKALNNYESDKIKTKFQGETCYGLQLP